MASFHLPAPDDMDDVLLCLRMGDTLRDAGLETGSRFSYSQALTGTQVEEACGWAGLHVTADGPCAMLVLRPTPRLPRGAWAANLHQMECDWPLVGRVVSLVPSHWIRLRPYTVHGEPTGTVEALDARWMVRIHEPCFPLTGVVSTRNGSLRRVASLGLVPWARRGPAVRRPGGLESADIDETQTAAAWLASNPRLCRSFGLEPDRVLHRLGLDAFLDGLDTDAAGVSIDPDRDAMGTGFVY